jgi:septal ring factor EnvC (AmiA/AmiB activator)
MTEPETLMDHFDQQPHHYPQPESPAAPTPHSVAEQLNSLLISAEGTAQRIVQEAEARARNQLAQAEQRIRAMEAESARLAAWSQQTEQMIQALSAAVADFRRDVEAIPQRISDALDPLASHVPVLVRQMEDLMGALSTPQAMMPSQPVIPQGSDAMVPEHSVEAGWAEGWDESANGAA